MSEVNGYAVQQLLKGHDKTRLSNEFGVTVRAIEKWMNGDTKPGRERIQQLADLIGVDKRFLFSGSDGDQSPTIPPQTGISRFYFGEDDDAARNDAKQAALCRAQGVAVLLAHTGQSYLATNGVHFGSVMKFVGASNEKNQFAAVLLNPFSTSAVQMYLSWMRRSMKSAEPYNARANLTNHMNKLVSVFNTELTIPTQQRQIFFTTFDFSSTVLVTDKDCFVEPYFRTSEEERQRRKLTSYELEMPVDSDFGECFRYESVKRSTHVDFFVKHSVGSKEWNDVRPRLLDLLLQHVTLMKDSGELDDPECADLIWYANTLQERLPQLGR